MNRWYPISRMRGAAFLILVGVLALLNQWRIWSWDQSWPLFLILWGVLALAERAAWAANMREYQAGQQAMGATGPGTGATSYWPGAPSANGSESTYQPPPENPASEGR